MYPPRLQHRVIHRRVEQMLCVKKEMAQALVPAYLNIMVTPIRHASPNVL